MKDQIEAWLQAAKKGVEENSAKAWPTTTINHNTLRWTAGPKYYRVTVCAMNGERGSAYCFIDMEGNVYKPAGYQAPAKGIRGTITTVDPSKLSGDTGWLYRRL